MTCNPYIAAKFVQTVCGAGSKVCTLASMRATHWLCHFRFDAGLLACCSAGSKVCTLASMSLLCPFFRFSAAATACCSAGRVLCTSGHPPVHRFGPKALFLSCHAQSFSRFLRACRGQVGFLSAKCHFVSQTRFKYPFIPRLIAF